MNTYNIKLDLEKGPLYSLGTLGGESGVVTLRQGDKQGCRINADLYDHGERFIQTGLTAFFVMDLPDHTHYYRAQATYSDGTVSVIVDESYAASAPGNTDNAYFELMQGSTVIASTQSFRVRVLKDARDGKSVPESYDSAIQEAIDNANAAAEEAREAAGGTPYKLPPATASTLGGVKVGDGLSVAADGELSVTNYGNIVTQSNFGVVLDETSRFTVVAADATSAAIISSAFGKEPVVRMPNVLTSAYLIYLAINSRYCLSWMNGAKMELAPLNVEVDTQTQAITLYARGRSSMAYGAAGVDESWTITTLPTDVDGVSY